MPAGDPSLPQGPSPSFPSDWTFYALGAVFVLLGVAFFLIPFLARSGALSNLKIPSIVLYVYSKDGFYFATSPILIIVSVISLLVFLLRR